MIAGSFKYDVVQSEDKSIECLESHFILPSSDYHKCFIDQLLLSFEILIWLYIHRFDVVTLSKRLLLVIAHAFEKQFELIEFKFLS